MRGVLAMGANRITNMAGLTGTQDSASKNYVDVLSIPKFTIVSGTIPYFIESDITLYTSPTGRLTVVKFGLSNFGLNLHLVNGLTLSVEVLKVCGLDFTFLVGDHQ